MQLYMSFIFGNKLHLTFDLDERGFVVYRCRWEALERFMDMEGPVLLLSLIAALSPADRFFVEMTQDALAVLQVGINDSTSLLINLMKIKRCCRRLCVMRWLSNTGIAGSAFW